MSINDTSAVIYPDVDLPEFNAIDKKSKDNGDLLYILVPKDRPEVCPECGSVSVHVHKKQNRSVQDLDNFGHRVGLLIEGRTYRCRDCGNLIRVDYPSLHGRMTKRLVEAIQRDSLNETFAAVADRYHTSITTVATIFNDFTDVLMAEHRFVAPTVLGIDEVHLEDDYRGVFVKVDRTEGRVLEFTKKRTKQSVIGTLRRMEEPQNLQLVTMDMWKPYRDAVNEVFPDVPVVIDHFHVIKNLMKAMDSVRASICRRIKTPDRKALEHNRFLMLRNHEDLTIQQGRDLNTLLEEYPELRNIYLLKETFRDIYSDAGSSAEARDMFTEWKQACAEADVNAYDDFIRTVESWSVEIFAYFDYPDMDRTNAQTESLNRRIRTIARDGRGYSFDVLRKKVILNTYRLDSRGRFSFKDFLDE